MKIQAQAYVNLSEIFDGFESIAEEWHSYDHGNFSFGTCNRSMIDKARFLGSLPESLFPIQTAFLERVDSIPEGVMIDLEN